MKKSLLVLALLAFLLTLSVAGVMAGKDDQPDVGYRPFDVSCGIYQYGVTADWWWAEYSNGKGVLKCIGETDNPPSEVTIEYVDNCGTPAGTTDDAFIKVFPNGAVHLICRTG